MKIGQLQINSTCNEDCFFCSRPTHDLKELSFNELKKEIDLILKKGVDTINITGGEPTLNKDILKIISYIKSADSNVKIKLQTNGIRLEDFAFSEKLKKSGIDNITIPLHTLDSKNYIKITRKDNLDKKLRAIDNIYMLKIPASILYIINKHNYKELYGLTKFIYSKYGNFFRIQFTNLCISKQDIKKMKDHVVEFPNLSGPLNQALKFCQQKGIQFDIDGIPLCIIKEFKNRCTDRLERNYAFYERLIEKPFEEYSFSDYESKKYIKIDRCIDCELKNECRGIYHYYNEIFDYDEIFDKREFDIDRIKDNVVQIILTEKCNQNCLFCSYDRESINKNNLVDKSLKVIDSIECPEHTEIVIDGGEPTLEKSLEEVISYVNKREFKNISLCTNGVILSNKQYLFNLKKSGLTKALISLHSNKEDLSDELTKMKGGFNKTVEGIKNSLLQGLIVSISHVINSKNYKDLSDFFLFVKREFPKASISLSFIRPTGNAMKNRWIVPKMTAVKPHLHKALALSIKQNIVVSFTNCALPLCFLEGYEHMSSEVRMNNINLTTAKKGDYFKKDIHDGKIKADDCILCKNDKICKGVWKEYVNIYGISELKPIVIDKSYSSVYDFTPSYYCNNNCLICTTTYSWMKYDKKSTEELISEIKSIPPSVKTIIFSGGEPTIRKDFFFLLKELLNKNENINVEILTNGRLFSIQSNVDKLRRFPSERIGIRIALNSIKEETHDKITQVKGSFKQTLKGINLLIESGFVVHCNFVLNKLNYKDLPFISKFIVKEIPKLNRIYFRNMFYIRNSFKNREILAIRISEISPFLEQGLEKLIDENVEFMIEAVPLCCLSEKYWKYVQVGARKYLIDNIVCRGCELKNDCCGIESTYADNFGIDEFRRKINQEYINKNEVKLNKEENKH